MIFPQLGQFTDLGLLFLRVMVAVVFFDSGRKSFFQAKERSQSIGMSVGFTRFLGVAEMAGALGVAFGVLTQLAALGLILIMLGAISKEDFCLAHRLLGQRRPGLELRFAVPGDEYRHPFHRRRTIRAAQVIGFEKFSSASEKIRHRCRRGRVQSSFTKLQ